MERSKLPGPRPRGAPARAGRGTDRDVLVISYVGAVERVALDGTSRPTFGAPRRYRASASASSAPLRERATNAALRLTDPTKNQGPGRSEKRYGP
jgi:hypothetical protein